MPAIHTKNDRVTRGASPWLRLSKEIADTDGSRKRGSDRRAGATVAVDLACGNCAWYVTGRIGALSSKARAEYPESINLSERASGAKRHKLAVRDVGMLVTSIRKEKRK